MYDQTGAGPEALGWDIGAVGAPTSPSSTPSTARGRRPRTTASSCSRSRSARTRTSQQFSQEFRLTSNNPDSRFDWIAGVYLQERRHQEDRPLHRRELPRQRAPGRQQSAVDAVRREPLGQRRQDRELRGLRADRLQVHRRPEAQRRRALHARQEGRQRQRLRGRDRRSLQPERSAAERDDRRPVPHAGPAASSAADGGQPRDLRRAEPVDLLRRHRLRRPTTRRPGARPRRRRPSSGQSSDTLFLYATVAEGFKGGGFDDTPANIAQAVTPFDPEEATQLRDRLQGRPARQPHAR